MTQTNDKFEELAYSPAACKQHVNFIQINQQFFFRIIVVEWKMCLLDNLNYEIKHFDFFLFLSPSFSCDPWMYSRKYKQLYELRPVNISRDNSSYYGVKEFKYLLIAPPSTVRPPSKMNKFVSNKKIKEMISTLKLIGTRCNVILVLLLLFVPAWIYIPNSTFHWLRVKFG